MSYSVKRYVVSEHPSTSQKEKTAFEIARPVRPTPPASKRLNEHSMNELKNEMQNLKVEVNRYVSRPPHSSKYIPLDYKSTLKYQPFNTEYFKDQFKNDAFTKPTAPNTVHLGVTLPMTPDLTKVRKVNAYSANAQQNVCLTPNANVNSFQNYFVQNNMPCSQKNLTINNTYSSVKDLNCQMLSDGNQSVTSAKIINQPLRRLGLQASSQNYDHHQYMQMEVELLTSELRNLKQKYLNKKQEMKEIVNGLEKKCNYLTVSLKKSENSLADYKLLLEKQMAIMKSQIINFSQSKPQPPRQNTGNQLMDQKINQLYNEIMQKNQKISVLKTELETALEDKTKTVILLKMETERSAELSKEIEFTKLEESRMKTHFQSQMNKKRQLFNNLQKMKNNQGQIINQMNNYQNTIDIKQKQYRIMQQLNKNLKLKQTKLSSQLSQIKQQLVKVKQINKSQCQQIQCLKKEQQQQYLKIENLNKKLRQAHNTMNEAQTNYRKQLDQQRRAHGEQLQKLQVEYQNTVYTPPVLSPRESVSNQIHEKHNAQLQKQSKRWKTEYKLLKRKHQELVQQQKSFISQAAANYKSYVDYKQKYDILNEKSKAAHQANEQYVDKLRLKENELTTKAIDKRILQNEYNRQNGRLQRQNNGYKREIKNLMQKNAEQKNLLEKQLSYRREIQAKMRQNIQPKQLIQRITKRLEEQDQKINKNLKQGKKKDALIEQLKQQVSEMMQSNAKISQEQYKKQLNLFIESYIKKQYQTIDILTKQTNATKNLYQQQLNSMLQTNSTLKQQLLTSKTQQNKIKDQLQNISHLYSQKCNQLTECQNKLQHSTKDFTMKLQQLIKQKNELRNIVNNVETMHKNEICGLRIQINTLTRHSNKIDYANFDDALRSQISLNKELKQQITRKNEELFKLRDSTVTYKTQYDNLKSEIEVIRLKAIAERKNIQINFQVDKQNMTNQLSTETQKVKSLEQKIKIVIDQTKKKDSFIQNYIIGKKLTSENQLIVKEFLKNYEITMNTNDIVQKIQSQTYELKRLSEHNLNLLKEIAMLKEKMLTYEAFQGEVSLFDSRLFGKSPSLIEATSPRQFEKSPSSIQQKSDRTITVLSPVVKSK